MEKLYTIIRCETTTYNFEVIDEPTLIDRLVKNYYSDNINILTLKKDEVFNIMHVNSIFIIPGVPIVPEPVITDYKISNKDCKIVDRQN